jgi:prevent-host-death family protein
VGKVLIFFQKANLLKRINITAARKNLNKIVRNVNESHEPIHIAGKNYSAVIIGQEDWKSIEETLYLTSIPGMRESIVEGMKEPLENLSEELDW